MESRETEFILIDPRFHLRRYLDLGKFRTVWETDGLALLKRDDP